MKVLQKDKKRKTELPAIKKYVDSKIFQAQNRVDFVDDSVFTTIQLGATTRQHAFYIPCTAQAIIGVTAKRHATIATTGNDPIKAGKEKEKKGRVGDVCIKVQNKKDTGRILTFFLKARIERHSEE